VVLKGPVDIKLNLYSWACSFILYQSNKWLCQKEFCLWQTTVHYKMTLEGH